MKQRGFGRAAAALAAGVALLAGEGALSGAAAQTKTAVTANELEAILTDAGLSPTMAEDAASGSPVAAGRLGDNIIFWVRALDCAGGPKACETLMFFVNFELGRPMTPKDYAVINSYNESQVFGRAYIIEEQGQVGVDYVVELGGGVTMDRITQSVSRWADVVAAFIDKFREGQGQS
ncbi:MAG: YbjN domain-containing protein [Parvularculaceae bacterium]